MDEPNTEPTWEEFESLVQWIVATIHPLARVTPNASVANAVTGDKREIDVLIDLQHGHLNLRVIGEVRNRNRVQDVQWVDEVQGKRMATGAGSAFMVSRSGFTQPARRAAAALGITLLTLEEATGALWSERLGFRSISIMTKSVAVSLNPVDRYRGQSFTVDEREWRRWNQELARFNRSAFVDELAHDTAEIARLCAGSVTRADELLRLRHGDVSVGEHRVDFRYRPPSSMRIKEQSGGLRKVDEFEAEVTFTYSSVAFPLTMIRYREVDGATHAALLSGDISYCGLPYRLRVVLPSETGALNLGQQASLKVEPLSDRAAQAMESATMDLVPIETAGSGPFDPLGVTLRLNLQLHFPPRTR